MKSWLVIPAGQIEAECAVDHTALIDTSMEYMLSVATLCRVALSKYYGQEVKPNKDGIAGYDFGWQFGKLRKMQYSDCFYSW